jgi:hypothetical protein
VSCRLCMDDGRLKSEELTIAFAAHGSLPSKRKALRSLARANSRGKGPR